MTTKKRVVLLACGSYNPITNMHLRLFELARDHLNKTGKYQVIYGIISPVSDGYAKKGLASAKHRCAMIKLALQSSDWIRLDSWEADQKNWTATANVLRHHYDNLLQHSDKSVETIAVATKKRKIDARNKNYIAAIAEDLSREPIEIKLLCGADVLESFGVPGLWKSEHMEEIASRFGLVVCTRSGSNVNQFIYESDLLTKYKNNIEIVTEWITNDISATKIRRAVGRGESVRYLLQDPVIDYIAKNQLYCCTTDSAKCDNDNTARQPQVGDGHCTSSSSSSSSSPDDIMTAADTRPSPLGDETTTSIISVRPNQLAVQPIIDNCAGLQARDMEYHRMRENLCTGACKGTPTCFNRSHSLDRPTLSGRCQPLLFRCPEVHQQANAFGTPTLAWCRPSVLAEQSNLLHNDKPIDGQNLNEASRQTDYGRQRHATTSPSTKTSGPFERSGGGNLQGTSLRPNSSTGPVYHQPEASDAISPTMATCGMYQSPASASQSSDYSPDSFDNVSIPTPLETSLTSATSGIGDDSLTSSTGSDEMSHHRQRQENLAQSAIITATPISRKKLSVSCVVSELISFVQRVRRMRTTPNEAQETTV